VITEKRNQNFKPFFSQNQILLIVTLLPFFFVNKFNFRNLLSTWVRKLENLRTVSSALHSHAYNKVIKEALTLKGTNDTFAVTSTSFNLKVVLSPSDTSTFDYRKLCT
jgi:hypothetical protein